MLPVYICEDDPRMLKELASELKKQIMIQEYDMEIILCTGDPEEVLEKAAKQNQRGLYFLDVDLSHDKLDGFSLGSQLRICDPRCYIIYVTSHTDLAFKIFEYHLEAMDYISKGDPLKMTASIRNCLACIVRRITEETASADANVFTVRENGITKIISLKDILFFETSPKKHRIILHADNERIEFTGNLQEIEERILAPFLRTHRSYLVNTDKIKEIDFKNRALTLVNGQTCLFARNKKHLLETYTV